MSTDRVLRSEARLAVELSAGRLLIEPGWDLVLRPLWLPPVRVVRPEDLLDLTYRFRNVSRRPRG